MAVYGFFYFLLLEQVCVPFLTTSIPHQNRDTDSGAGRCQRGRMAMVVGQ